MTIRLFQNSFVFIVSVIFLASCASHYPTPQKYITDQYVVMLSLDGCRWDYPQIADMPNLERIARHGVKAASVRPSFPSKTFPNHYAIATGLYPDHHGIVQNTFYDPEMGRQYKIADRSAVEDGAFYAGEPIWITAEKQGLNAASFFWVGSEADVMGSYPSIWKPYDHNFPYEARVDSVIAWLQLPKQQRPRLITWYYPEPDGVGHRHGPESDETKEMLHYLDSLVGDFLDKLATLPIADQVNVIITSDHGMSATSAERTVFLDKVLKPEWIEMTQGSNPIMLFDASEGYEDSVLNALVRAPGVSAWRHGELPDTLNYGTHPRTLDVIAVGDIGWTLLEDSEDFEPGYSGGSHGYESRHKDMHNIFYATGPAFKRGYIHPGFENVNIYPLIAHILDLEIPEVDGKLSKVSSMLRQRD